MNNDERELLSKVPAVTLGFWIIKVLATTLGETGGDTLSMTMELGYLAATGIFALLLLGLVAAQVMARRFYPLLYWTTIIASTTAGTRWPTMPPARLASVTRADLCSCWR